MSRVATLLGLVGRAPTVLRTVAALRPAQARAQLAHLWTGVRAPVRLDGADTTLAVAAPATPFLPPAPHVGVEAGPEGRLALELLALDLALSPGEIDWTTDRHGPLFAYHLHEQAWLRHASVSPGGRQAVIEDWLANHPSGIGWDPHPISLRLLSWGKLLLTEGALPADEALRARLRRSMADQAETLALGLEVRLQANHLLSNRIGVVFAGLLFEGACADRWRAESDALLAEFASQIHRDGGHEERSPMYHALILENGLDLLNLARATPRAPAGFVTALEGVLRRMVEALALYTGPDGRILLFADAAWDVAAEPASLFDYAMRLGVVDAVPSTADGVLRFGESAYHRIEQGPFVLVASTGGPAPRHQPGHAHCDALAFELFVEGRRLVSDTGVFEYRPGPRRDRARATTSHATLAFDGVEQSEVWSAHRVGGRAQVEQGALAADGFVLAVRGWSRGAPRHERAVHVSPDHVSLRDRVADAGHAVESRLPIAPEWSVEVSGDRARCRHEAGDLEVEIRMDGPLVWTVERAAFYPGFHREVERDVLVGRGHTALTSTIGFRIL
ncbi:MAG: heparinase II/III family protein [Myxococcota bacterium]